MPTIELDHLSFSFTDRPLLEHVSLRVGDGERACLVGPNGSGKTTLLRLVAGSLTPDAGTAAVTGTHHATPEHLPDVLTADGTVQDHLDRCCAPLLDVAARFEAATAALADGGAAPDLVATYDRLLAAMTALGVWSLSARTDELLAGLGLPQLTDEGRARPLATLSPGQARRLELVATLLASPEVLLLDEPTNHLDGDAVQFLVRLLQGRTGPLLFASHDRAFIDDVATVVLDLDTAAWQALATARGEGGLPGVQACAGTYSDYLVAKQQARAAHEALHQSQQATTRAVRAHRHASTAIARGGVRLAEAQGKAKKFFADRAQATSVRRTRDDDRRLEALARVEVRKPRHLELHLALDPVPARPGLAVMARRATVDRRLAPTTLDLAHGERLLVTGPNGAGKSTLLSWIALGRAPVGATSSGTVVVDGRVGVVPQRLPSPGDPGMNAATWRGGGGNLGAGLLHPSLWATPVPELSAGNQRRAQLALATRGAPELLVIDEPTNYLDLDAVEALEAALAGWNGTLVVASHDRWLIKRWPGRRLHLEGCVER